ARSGGAARTRSALRRGVRAQRITAGAVRRNLSQRPRSGNRSLVSPARCRSLRAVAAAVTGGLSWAVSRAVLRLQQQGAVQRRQMTRVVGLEVRLEQTPVVHGAVVHRLALGDFGAGAADLLHAQP